jgi:cytochrome P450
MYPTGARLNSDAVRRSDVSREFRRRAFPLGASVTLEELEGDPYALFNELRASEPVTWCEALNSWLVTTRELALAVVRDPGTFTVDHGRMSVRGVLGTNMLTVDGDEHRRHRQPFARPFRLATIRTEFEAYLTETVNALLDDCGQSGSAELRSAMAGPLAVRTVARALGLPATDIATVLDWYEAFASGMTTLTTTGVVPPESVRAFDAFRQVVQDHLAREAPGAESLLLQVVRGGESELSPDELVSNAALIMFGGIETTESLILNALWLLLTHEDQLQRLLADRGLLENAVEEVLRMEAAVASFERFATRTAELARVRIEAGDAVTLLAGAANRDPSFYSEPDRFDIARHDAKHNIAFAAGPHVCLGMHLARFEARAAVGALLDRFPRVRIDVARSVPPRGLLFRKPPMLTVVFDT